MVFGVAGEHSVPDLLKTEPSVRRMRMPPETQHLDIQTLIDSIPYYVMVIDADHNILMTNRAVVQDLGIKDRDAIIGSYCPKSVHGLDEPYPGCPLEDALMSGGNAEREFYDSTAERWVSSAIFHTGEKTSAGKEIFLHFISDITQRKSAEEKNKINFQTQKVMNRILKLSLEDVPLEAILLKVLDLILSMPWLVIERRGAIFLVGNGTQTLEMKAQRNLSSTVLEQCRTVPFGTCICGLAASRGRLQFASHGEIQHTRSCHDGPHGHYCVPIHFNEELLGVINLYLKEDKKLDSQEADILMAIAHSLAGVIKRVQMDDALRLREHELDLKSSNLEEMNAALRVLLRKREEDKSTLEDNILSNIKSLVEVYLEKLKKSSLSMQQAGYIEILEANLNSIISPFSHSLTLKHFNLTPQEIKVADLIRQGKATKEMAELLNLSARTIDFHRQNIRRKLNIHKKAANLRTYLENME